MKFVTALVVIAALGVVGCGSSSDNSSTSSAASTTASSGGGAYGGAYGNGSTTTKSTKSVSNASSGEVKIGMFDDYFTPKTISGKPGSTVKVELKNNGSREHNFKIDGQKAADADVKPGEDGTATVTIPASGSVQFYCEYHKGLGMVGTVKAST